MPHMGRDSGGHAHSYLLASESATAGSVAEEAASKKDNIYSAIAQTHVFVPLAIEILGPINFNGLKFLSELCDRLTVATNDPRVSTLFASRALSLNSRRPNFSHYRNCF